MVNCLLNQAFAFLAVLLSLFLSQVAVTRLSECHLSFGTRNDY